MGRISRRVLLAGVAAAATGCGAPPHTPSPVPVADRTGPSATPNPTIPAPTPSASATPAVPSRADIVARFGSRRPTQWGNGEFAPMASLVRRTETQKVVLTLDACGGPGGSGYDRDLIDLLRRERIPAVLFLNKRWIEANRAEFDRFAAEQDLFDIGNHGTRHTPLSVSGRSQYKEPGTKDAGEVYDEVVGNHLFLTELLGKAPRYFRTGTAWYDEVALDIIRACGEVPIGFDTNGDAGTTYSAAQTAAETARARPGSIIIGHFNQPKHATFEGMREALPKMRARGVEFAKLSDCGV